MQKGEGC